MGKFYDEIPQSHFEWIKKQHMFFVATAPLCGHGHVNVSPKGTADCFHVVNSKQVWYEDLSGSGVETISHVRENGRITIMFCALEGPPRIMRLFGVGTIHEYGSEEYNKLIPPTTRKPGSRAAIVIDVYQVGTSCGFAVPLYEFAMHRTQLLRMCDKIEDTERALAASRNARSSDGGPRTSVEGDAKGSPPFTLRTYWLRKNMKSLDGLPGLLTAPDAVLDMVPQNNFDKDGARPMMRDVHSRGKGVDNAARDRRWFASGLVIGAISMFAITRVVESLKR